jgi:hypothetical protein
VVANSCMYSPTSWVLHLCRVKTASRQWSPQQFSCQSVILPYAAPVGTACRCGKSSWNILQLCPTMVSNCCRNTTNNVYPYTLGGCLMPTPVHVLLQDLHSVQASTAVRCILNSRCIPENPTLCSLPLCKGS